MLDKQSPLYLHVLQNLTLIWLSLLFLPLSSFIVACALVFGYVLPGKIVRNHQIMRKSPGFRTKTILVTGVSMTKGLTLARLFYQAGHKVIGADFESGCALVCGHFSRSLYKFCPLEKPTVKSGSHPYITSLIDIIKSDGVDLWVSCSGVASAVEDGEVKQVIESQTQCQTIQFDMETTQTLHEKHSFIESAKDIGLSVPQTSTITSASAVEHTLKSAPRECKFIMKPVGMDDVHRGDMTLLPKASTTETKAHLSRFIINKDNPCILQQYIQGPEYCTHSLVIKGEVKAFVACPSAELLMHYAALPPDLILSRAMLEFTQTYARAQRGDFTGHLSFDFMIEQSELDHLKKNQAPKLYPIECNPRAHTAAALFNDTPKLADAYLALLDHENGSIPTTYAEITATHTAHTVIQPLHLDTKYYWIGHDLVTLVLLPLLSLALSLLPLRLLADFVPQEQRPKTGSDHSKTDLDPVAASQNLARGMDLFIDHLIFWKDGTFEAWDPLPWFVLYHVYWPMQFVNALLKGRDGEWSRINVSTTKMFMC